MRSVCLKLKCAMYGCRISAHKSNTRSARPVTRKRLQALFDASFAYFGPLCWWPGDSAFEICVGAILTQNTAWSNVEKAIGNLKKKHLLSLRGMARCKQSDLAAAIRPAGYYNQKSERLHEFCRHVIARHRYLGAMLRQPLPTLREELLSLRGIGPETADSIILYAAEQPIFVVDAYTRRILSRMGLLEEDIGYHDLQAVFHDHLTPEVDFFGEFHAQLVYVGKQFCKKKNPRCADCPVRLT